MNSLPAESTLSDRLNKIHENRPSSGPTDYLLFCSGF